MSYQAMHKLREKLCDELDDLSMSGKLDLEKIHMLTDTIKNIDKIEAMDEGYSEGMWQARGTTGDSYGRHSSRGYSRNGGYSSARDEITEHIRERMNDNSLSNGERESLRRAMDAMR